MSIKKRDMKKEEIFDDDEDEESYGDEYSDEDDDNSYEEKKDRKNSRKRSKKTKKSKGKNKKARTGIQNFFEDEADVDDDVSENIDDAEINDVERQKIWDRYNQKDEIAINRNKYRDMNEEQMQEYIKGLDERDQNYYEYEEGDAAQQSIFPSNSDPSKPLEILSATISDKVQGNLYIEAFKEIHVRNAIKGLRLIYQREIIRIKKEETVTVFDIDKAAKVNLKRGQWVRVNSGLYSGDYAKVSIIDEAKSGCYIKLIPRLNIESNESKDQTKRQDKAKILRPPQKFFLHSSVEGAQLKYSNHFEKRMHYWNRMYFRRGFLYKYFNFKVLDTENIVPPREILDKFLRPDGDNDSHPSDSEDPDEQIEKWKKMSAENLTLTKGDKIKVISGDLKNLTGYVVSVERQIVTMQPDHKDLPQMLDLDLKMISKHFETGDHVCVINGENQGEKGIITKITHNKCIVFSDIRKKEFITLANNLKLSSQVAESVTANIDHDYNVYDFISTNKRNCGVVLSIEKNTLKIINQGGEVETIEVVDVKDKIPQKKNVSTLDNGGNYISVGDTVKVVEGPNKGLKGIIRYINQNTIFLYNKEFKETLGIFVEINRNVLILGEDLINRGMAAPTNKRKDPLIGKIVTICKGEYKGFEAKVVDSNDKEVRIELFHKSKHISLKKTDVIEKDKIKDEDDKVKVESSSFVPKTPAYVPNTPGYAMNSSYNYSPEWTKQETNEWKADSSDE